MEEQSEVRAAHLLRGVIRDAFQPPAANQSRVWGCKGVIVVLWCVGQREHPSARTLCSIEATPKLIAY